MSLRIDEDGVVTITTPYSWEPGRRLFIAGGWAELTARQRRHEAAFEDYLARLARRARVTRTAFGVSVRATTSVAVNGSKTDRFTKRKGGKSAGLVDFGSET